MPLAFSKADVRHACGDRAYARGRDYARHHRVLDIDPQQIDEGLRVRSSVRGNAVYGQEIHVSEFMDVIEIEGECTCPVGYNCKHVAAALTSLLEEARPEPLARQRQQIEHWVTRVAEARTPEQWLPELGEQILLYVLAPSARQTHRVEVRLQISRVLKSGKGYGKPRTLGLYEMQGTRMQQVAQPVDDTILRLLSGLSRYYAIELRGDLGAMALTRMLATGRLHWRDINDPPLHPGEPRQLQVAWRHEGDQLHLSLDTEPGGAILLNVDPPAFIDPQLATVGPLTLDPGLDYRTLDALLDAPSLPQELATEVSDLLLQAFPEMALPLPAARALNELRDLTPTPVLRLTAHRMGDAHERRLVHVVMIGFDYAGRRVGLPFDAVSQLPDTEGVTRILRDTDSEVKALHRLLAFGFDAWQPDGASEPAFFLPGEHIEASARLWQEFIANEVPALRDEGWLVEQDPAFSLRFVRAEDLAVDVEEHGHWFALGIGVEFEGRRIDLVPVLARLVERIDRPEDLPDDQPLMLEIAEAQWLELPAARIKPLVATLFDLFDRADPEADSLPLNRVDAVRLQGLDQGIVWRGGEALRALGERLAELQDIPPMDPPEGLQCTLRPYQLQGLAWLEFLRETGFGGVLADHMGLGKTVQTLALLLAEQHAKRLDRPALVVAPTSLMANWRHEAARFTPSLRVLTLHGPERRAHFKHIGDYDLVLTTYPLLRRDHEVLLAQEFHYLILDEAQNIKNPRAKAAQIVRELDARHRLCLTGTPMENHLGELWSLFHFLAPGYLGDAQQFRRLFRVPIEEHGDQARRTALQRRIAPFLLRRTKQAVASELPEKLEIVRTVALDDSQAGLYESVRAAMDKQVRESLSRKGLARSQITILDALLKLRQICCDPRLVKLEQARKVEQSAKLELLLEMLPELLEEGRRILLFSQFTTMLGLIENELKRAGIEYTKLTGQTRKREQVIEAFRSGAVPLFLISLKAGGVGLNLTEADTVIHYDPWWNPAVENQATDRAHRIGQTNTVFVYKLVTEQTVEEKILALQARKAALASGLYREGQDQQGLGLSEDDLRELLQPLD
jgi:superfamily II DNA or RNA helicase